MAWLAPHGCNFPAENGASASARVYDRFAFSGCTKQSESLAKA